MTKQDVLKQVGIINKDNLDVPEALLDAMDIWGKIKWNEAQRSAAERSRARKNAEKFKQGFPISITPYKP
jgi:hypothetical protein